MIVGYCRLSRDDGNDQSTSIINQKKIITKWTEDNNMSIDKWYCDDGYTCINFDRPDMKKLIVDLNNNRISTIIVKDYSRIGRKNTKVQEFVENLLLSNVRLISINDGYDSSSCGEDDMLPIKAWMNEIYVKDISKKVKQSFQSMFEKGNLIINVPYGYIKDPFVKNKYYVDKETARYVPMIFNWYIEGFGVLHIVKKLTDIGAPTATVKMKKLSRRHKEIFEYLILYFNDSDPKKVSPTAATKYMNDRNVGVKYMTVVNLWNQLIEDGSIVKNEGYNAGYSLTKSPIDIANDYLNYKNCLAIPECLNDTDENVNQALDIETIIDISNWINESFKNINKKTLF